MNSSPSPDPGAQDPASQPAASDAPGAPAPAPAPDSVHGGFFRWVRSFGVVRGGDRWFGGVATGIAARTGLDPVLIRGLFVVLGVFGVGFLVYGVAWALLPEPDGRIHLERAGSGTWTSGMTGALIFALIGMGGPGASFLGADNWFGAAVWTLFWIGAGVAAIYWFSAGKGHHLLPGHRAAADTAGIPDPAGGTNTAGTAGTQETRTGKPVTLAKQGTPAAGTVPFAAASPGGSVVPQPSAAAPSPEPAGSKPVDSKPDKNGSACTAKAVPGPSGAFAAALLGAALLAGGAALALDYVNVIPFGSPFSVALAAAAAVLGIGIVILGLAGRHSSGIGTAAVAALVASLLTQGSMVNANLLVASNADWVPRDAAQAAGGYTVIAANGTVDLRETETSGSFEVPASVAAGNLGILVPDDVPVTIRFGMAAGNVEVNDGSNRQEYSGLWQPSDERTLNDGADGDRITIDVRGLAGNVLVTTEESDL